MMPNNLKNKQNYYSYFGFTVVELLIVIGIIGILAAIVVSRINPPKLLAGARNNERKTHLNSILLAVGQRIADNDGSFNCASGPLPTSTKRMASSTATTTYDIAPCLVPSYLAVMPFDSNSTSSYYTSVSDYNTGYDILKSSTTNRITLSAPFAELGEIISVTK